MYNTYCSISKYFFKNKINLFFSIILPFILVMLSTLMFTFNMDLNLTGSTTTTTFLAPFYVVPGTSTLGLTCIFFISLPLLLINFKQKDIFKRITIKSERKIDLILPIVFFYTTFAMISYALYFSFAACLICMVNKSNGPYVIYMLQNANYIEIIYSLILIGIVGSLIGIIMSYIFTKSLSCEVAGLFLVILSIVTWGGGIPLQFMKLSGVDVLWSLSYLSPFHFSMMSLIESWTQGILCNSCGHSSIFNPNQQFISNLVPLSPTKDWSSVIVPTLPIDIPIIQEIAGKSFDEAYWIILLDPVACHYINQIMEVLGINSSDPLIYTFSSTADKWANIFMPYVYIMLTSIALAFTFQPKKAIRG